MTGVTGERAGEKRLCWTAQRNLWIPLEKGFTTCLDQNTWRDHHRDQTGIAFEEDNQFYHNSEQQLRFPMRLQAQLSSESHWVPSSS